MRKRNLVIGAVVVVAAVAGGVSRALGVGPGSGIQSVNVTLTGTRSAGSTETLFMKGGVCFRSAQETWTGTADGADSALSGTFTMTLDSLDQMVLLPGSGSYVPESGRSTGTIIVVADNGSTSSYNLKSVDTLNGDGLFTEGFISGTTKPPPSGAGTVESGPFFANFSALVSDPDHFTGRIGAPISGQPENSGIILVRVGKPTAKACPTP